MVLEKAKSPFEKIQKDFCKDNFFNIYYLNLLFKT